MRISHRISAVDSECGSDTDSDDGEISADEGDALAAVQAPKCVRFSDSTVASSRDLTRTPPLTAFDDGFETVYDQFQASKMLDSEAGDLGVERKRMSMSERQFHEMHLGGR